VAPMVTHITFRVKVEKIDREIRIHPIFADYICTACCKKAEVGRFHYNEGGINRLFIVQKVKFNSNIYSFPYVIIVYASVLFRLVIVLSVPFSIYGSFWHLLTFLNLIS